MTADLLSPRLVVPYIAAWSEERELPMTVFAGRSGIGYTDETVIDRDSRGVLWTRMLSCPRTGRPRFGQEHPIRQRKAMRKLLCQVCGKPANHTEDGFLWLLRDYRDDWAGWPDGMANTDPPVCVPCARMSVRLCPALRKGYVAVRARSEISGVYGIRYRAGYTAGTVEVVGEGNVAYDDPAIRWTRAAKLIGVLRDSTIIQLDSRGLSG